MYDERTNLTEIKNLNSFKAIHRAIESEEKRQADLLLRNEAVWQQTRRYDPRLNKTHLMRIKETRADYRFLREYDIPSITLDDADIARIGAAYIPQRTQRPDLSGYDLSIAQQDLLL